MDPPGYPAANCLISSYLELTQQEVRLWKTFEIDPLSALISNWKEEAKYNTIERHEERYFLGQFHGLNLDCRKVNHPLNIDF